MIKLIAACILLPFLIQQIICVASYKKIALTDPGALCIDGTPGAYYVHEGYQKNKWLINFEDSGWCGSSQSLTDTLEDCLARSSTDLGSSSKYGATWTQSDGILSDSYSNGYREYSIAHLKSCTGTGHQGYRQLPIVYKGKNLYFRGHNVTIAQLQSLNSLYKIFSAATNIVVTGQSSGALAVLLWANYIRDRAAPLAKVTALPDSGIFLNSYNLNTKRREYAVLMQSFMAISNQQINPPIAECTEAYPGQQWKCMFAQYSLFHIKVPVFAIQSPYDSWSLKNILGVSCENGGSLAACTQNQLNYIQEYHTNMSIVLKAITAKSTKNGYWAPSCSNHVYSTWNALYDSAFRIPGGSANTLMIGISQWDQGLPKTYDHMDKGNWPINKPCSGVKSMEVNP